MFTKPWSTSGTETVVAVVISSALGIRDNSGMYSAWTRSHHVPHKILLACADVAFWRIPQGLSMRNHWRGAAGYLAFIQMKWKDSAVTKIASNCWKYMLYEICGIWWYFMGMLLGFINEQIQKSLDFLSQCDSAFIDKSFYLTAHISEDLYTSAFHNPRPQDHAAKFRVTWQKGNMMQDGFNNFQ